MQQLEIKSRRGEISRKYGILLCRESVTMKLLQENAELGVREMLMEIGSKTKVTVNETNQCSNQGLYIIFQMDWKRCIIMLTKILQSSLRPEVYPEISHSTVSIYCHDVQYGCLVLL